MKSIIFDDVKYILGVFSFIFFMSFPRIQIMKSKLKLINGADSVERNVKEKEKKIKRRT